MGHTRSLVSRGVHTLITGDRVLVQTTSRGTTAAVLPGSRAHTSVRVMKTAHHLYVVPTLPTALMGALDPSLFDLTAVSDAAKATLTVSASGALPPGLTRTSATTARVTNPTAFGAALAAQQHSSKRTAAFAGQRRSDRARRQGLPALHRRPQLYPTIAPWTDTPNWATSTAQKNVYTVIPTPAAAPTCAPRSRATTDPPASGRRRRPVR